jgi:copper chaperone CopZ
VGNCEGFRGLERVISDIPGIISVEFAGETGKARVVFDKRITETAMLKRILGENGYTAA